MNDGIYVSGFYLALFRLWYCMRCGASTKNQTKPNQSTNSCRIYLIIIFAIWEQYTTINVCTWLKIVMHFAIDNDNVDASCVFSHRNANRLKMKMKTENWTGIQMAANSTQNIALCASDGRYSIAVNLITVPLTWQLHASFYKAELLNGIKKYIIKFIITVIIIIM